MSSDQIVHHPSDLKEVDPRGPDGRHPHHKISVMRKIVTQDIDPVRDCSTTLFQGTNEYKLDFDTENFEVLRDIALRYTVTNDASEVMLPPEMHFTEFSIYTGKGMHAVSQTWDARSLWLISNGFQNNPRRHYINKYNRMSKYGMPHTNSWAVAASPMNCLLDLGVTWLANFRLFGPANQQDIQIRLKPRNRIGLRDPSDGTYSAGSITNSTITVQTTYDELTHAGYQKMLQKYSESDLKHDMLSPQLFNDWTLATLAASTSYDKRLESFTGSCAALLVWIETEGRGGTGWTGMDQGRDALLPPYQDLGLDGEIQVLDTRTNELLNRGTPNTVRYIESRMREFLPNDFLEKSHVYVIPFDHDPVTAFRTGRKGSTLPFNNNNDYTLRIKTGTAGVASSLVIDEDVKQSDGTFYFTYGTHKTRPMEFDSTVVQINHELRLLGAHYGVIPYISGTLDGAAAVTVAFTGHVDHEDRILTLHRQADEPFDAGGQVWTPGQRGFLIDPSDNGNFRVNVLALTWDQLVFRNSEASVRQMSTA